MAFGQSQLNLVPARSDYSVAKPHPERIAPLLDVGPADLDLQNRSKKIDLQRSNTAKRTRPKWHLGITSQSKETDVMKELYKYMINNKFNQLIGFMDTLTTLLFRTLIALGFEWKNLSYFKLRIRYENKRKGGKYDKMTVTLYKVIIISFKK